MKNFETPNGCLERAAEAIKDGIDIGLYKGHLCIFQKVLAFRPSKHTNERHTIFMNITTEHTSKGLNTDEWNELNRRLWNFFKEIR